MYRLYVIAQVSPPSELHEGVEQAKEKPQNAPNALQSENRNAPAVQESGAPEKPIEDPSPQADR